VCVSVRWQRGVARACTYVRVRACVRAWTDVLWRAACVSRHTSCACRRRVETSCCLPHVRARTWICSRWLCSMSTSFQLRLPSTLALSPALAWSRNTAKMSRLRMRAEGARLRAGDLEVCGQNRGCMHRLGTGGKASTASTVGHCEGCSPCNKGANVDISPTHDSPQHAARRQ
jgi:hypothetical protein